MAGFEYLQNEWLCGFGFLKAVRRANKRDGLVKIISFSRSPRGQGAMRRRPNRAVRLAFSQHRHHQFVLPRLQKLWDQFGWDPSLSLIHI